MGRVAKANQPNFYAYTTQIYTDTGALTGGSKWGEKWDTGNNFYLKSTFTAPVAGKYYFEVMWDANGIQSTILTSKYYFSGLGIAYWKNR